MHLKRAPVAELALLRAAARTHVPFKHLYKQTSQVGELIRFRYLIKLTCMLPDEIDGELNGVSANNLTYAQDRLHPLREDGGTAAEGQTLGR